MHKTKTIKKYFSRFISCKVFSVVGLRVFLVLFSGLFSAQNSAIIYVSSSATIYSENNIKTEVSDNKTIIEGNKVLIYIASDAVVSNLNNLYIGNSPKKEETAVKNSAFHKKQFLVDKKIAETKKPKAINVKASKNNTFYKIIDAHQYRNYNEVERNIAVFTTSYKNDKNSFYPYNSHSGFLSKNHLKENISSKKSLFAKLIISRKNSIRPPPNFLQLV